MQNQQTSTMIALKNFSMHPQNYLNASSRPAATVIAQSISAPSSTSEDKDVGRLPVPQCKKEESQEHMANSGEQENGETGSVSLYVKHSTQLK